jgi:phosphonatase-like hydrolase
MIELAVLDMAGTTVRDDGVVEGAFVTALAGMGFDPDGPETATHLEYVRATMGQSKIDVFTTVFGGDTALAQEANERFEIAFDDAVSRGEVEALPGAETTLTALRAMGLRICLTTGFSRATREQVLDVLGWRDLVDLALSPEEGIRGRPYPDLVLHAVIRLQVDDVRDVAVAGDTVSDLIAGRRAGASVVAGVLTGAHDRRRLAEGNPTHILRGIDELPAVIAGARGPAVSEARG